MVCIVSLTRDLMKLSAYLYAATALCFPIAVEITHDRAAVSLTREVYSLNDIEGIFDRHTHISSNKPRSQHRQIRIVQLRLVPAAAPGWEMVVRTTLEKTERGLQDADMLNSASTIDRLTTNKETAPSHHHPQLRTRFFGAPEHVAWAQVAIIRFTSGRLCFFFCVWFFSSEVED